MEKNCSVEWGHSPVPDLDLEICRGGGGWGGHTDPVIRGGGGKESPNYFFDPSGLTLI